MLDFRISVLLLAAIFFHSDTALVQAEETNRASDNLEQSYIRPKIALVLGGGGAKGAAHIGVLKQLEAMQVPIDLVVGTSMGAIIGGLYAAGMSPAEIEQAYFATDWNNLFSDATERSDVSFRRKRDDDLNLIGARVGVSSEGLSLSKALVQGQKFDLVLNALTEPVAHIHNFDHLNIPFRAVATDLASGNEVVLNSGNLARAMRASMSVPAAFAGVDTKDYYLVDGGVSNNLPVSVAQAMGADVVIAVSLSTPLKQRDELNSSLDVIGQLVSLLTYRNVQEQKALLRQQDILLEPDLSGIGSSAFDKTALAISHGEKIAQEYRLLLGRFSHQELFQTYTLQRDQFWLRHQQPQQVLAFFDIDNQTPLSESFIRSRLTDQTGHAFDKKLLEQEITDLYGLDVFENIRYELTEKDGENGVVVSVLEKSWGPDYLQVGAAIGGSADEQSSVNLSLAYTRTMLNGFNGEWRTYVQMGDASKIISEWYQPLDRNSRYYANPHILVFDRQHLQQYQDGYPVGEFRIRRYGIGLAFGRELGNWGDIRLAWRWRQGDVDVIAGTPIVDEGSFHSGELVPRIQVDTLDSVNFPTKGILASWEWLESRKAFGADDNFSQWRLDALLAETFERNTLFGGLKIYTTPNDDAPVQNYFVAGGFQNFSGYQFNELNGQHFALMRMGLMRRINDFQWMPAYAGFTLEAGQVTNDSERFLRKQSDMLFGGNVFFGLDTAIGPLYFAYGNSEQGSDSFYLFLGKPFTIDR